MKWTFFRRNLEKEEDFIDVRVENTHSIIVLIFLK